VTECYRREQSVVPQQALAMTNSHLVLDSSKPIAARIARSMPADGSDVDDAEFIRRAFTVLLGFSPNEVELNASRQAMEQWRKLPTETSQAARSNLIWSLLNHNDFVTLR